MNDEVIIKNDLNVEEYNYLREEVNWNKKNPDFIKMAIENSTIVKKAMLKDTIVGMKKIHTAATILIANDLSDDLIASSLLATTAFPKSIIPKTIKIIGITILKIIKK